MPGGEAVPKMRFVMSTATRSRLPWEDRWHEPTIDELIEPQKETIKRLVPGLLEQIEQLDGVERRLAWHGTSWKWTVEYPVPQAKEAKYPLAYFVPNPEQAEICVPLRPEHIEKLPIRRLNRFIRDNIRSSKCAVEIHWAKFTPSSQAEAEHLMDLIKRKHKMLLAQTHDEEE